MVQYCVVFGCKNNSSVKKISFHTFPLNPCRRKQWIKLIRRDKCNKPVSQTMRVCSSHFVEEDFMTESEFGIPYKNKKLKEASVPTIFSFGPPKKPRRVFEWHVDITSNKLNRIQVHCPADFGSGTPSIGAANIAIAEPPAGCNVPGEYLLAGVNNNLPATSLQVFNEPAANADRDRLLTVQEAMIDSLQREVDAQKLLLADQANQLNMKFDLITARPRFNMDFVKSTPKLVKYFTGFDSKLVLEIFHDFVDKERAISFSKKLSPDNQLLLVLSKLRQGLENFDLAVRFDVSVNLVSKIFVRWINYLYHYLGCLSIWPHRDIIIGNAPKDFMDLHPNTLIILDGTEMKMQTPASLVVQSQSYSSYKSHTTVKALVGCDPKGGLIFVSQLYTGSISDKQITKASGLYEVLERKLVSKEILPGDVIMVDKGFNICREVEALGLVLNVPPMASSEQFSEEDVCATRKIASCRIHVERAIRRIKTFKILKGVIPMTTLPSLNQVWTVCCVLTGFRCVTKSK